MYRITFFAFTLLVGLTAFVQNTSPEVTIQNVAVDEVLQQVTITYDLADAQAHNCEVWLKVSNNGGDFFIEVDPADVSGDVGLALTPSVSKTIVWDYSNFTTTIYDTKFSVHASDNQPLDIQLMVDQVDSNSLKIT